MRPPTLGVGREVAVVKGKRRQGRIPIRVLLERLRCASSACLWPDGLWVSWV